MKEIKRRFQLGVKTQQSLQERRGIKRGKRDGYRITGSTH